MDPEEAKNSSCSVFVPWNQISFHYLNYILSNKESKSVNDRDFSLSGPKPPNIYTISSPDHDIKNSEIVKHTHMLENLISSEHYVVQLMPKSEFLNYNWFTSTQLLVLLQNMSSKSCIQDISNAGDYLINHGKVIIFLRDTARAMLSRDNLFRVLLSGDIMPVSNLIENASAEWKWFKSQNDNPCLMLHRLYKPCLAILDVKVLEHDQDFLRYVLEQMSIEITSLTEDDLRPTAMHFFKRDTITDTIETSLKAKFYANGHSVKSISNTDDLSTSIDSSCVFQFHDYFNRISTKTIGRSPGWAKVMGSSWTIMSQLLENLPLHSGTMLCSDMQTSGHGRGGNKWISPRGMAAFTFHATIEVPAALKLANPQEGIAWLARSASCMQHIAGLAVVLTCRRLLAQALNITAQELDLFHDPKYTDPITAHVDDPRNVLQEDCLTLGEDDDCLPASSKKPKNSIDELDSMAKAHLPGSQFLVKWPNDVYAVDPKLLHNHHHDQHEPHEVHPSLKFGKIAGVLTKSSMEAHGDAVNILIGVGVNVANVKPTLCLHDVIRAAQSQYLRLRMMKKLAPMNFPQDMPSVGTFVAEYMNVIEVLINEIQEHSPLEMNVFDLSDQQRGLSRVLDLYTKCWAHKNQTVKIAQDVEFGDDHTGGGALTDEYFTIKGIDKYGYLIALNEKTGERHTLHPDGNSLDMMQGLISRKKTKESPKPTHK